jgi:beta-glucosidase
MMPWNSTYADEARTIAGLKGEVFNNQNLEGQPVATRNDRFLNLHWSADQPMPGTPTENCSIRWSGYLVWPADEEVTLGIATEGGVRLVLDDKPVLDQWKSRATRTYRVDYSFKKGIPVKIRLEYSHGPGPAAIQLGSNPFEKAVDYSKVLDMAKRSDLVILTLGITPQLEGEQMPVRYEGFAEGDRTSILLPAPQIELLRHVASVGRPVVVVLTGGSALAFDPRLANGVLLQWYSGEQGGNAVADALVGEANPAGRLPVTFYRSDRDLPPFENYHLDGRTYRFFKGRPLFPFGYGLSYASFKYGAAKIADGVAGYSVSVPVTNTSKVAGDEVVEVYARYGHPLSSDPVRRLVGFKRVSLAPGETKDVRVDVTNWALRSWNETRHAYEDRPDRYTLEVGPCSGKALSTVLLKIQ